MSYGEQRIKNEFFDLHFLPQFGCHWTQLKIYHQNQWRDLLYPVPHLKRPELGSFMMAPWANRIVKGAFEFEGKRHQLRINFPDDTAIHGDVRTKPWRVKLERNQFEAFLDSSEFSDFNFPFKLSYEHRVTLDRNTLHVELFIQNTDSKSAPVGMGFHPFFKRKLTEKDKDVVLILPAEKVSPDEKCIPKAPPVPVTPEVDLRQRKFLGNPKLDHCYAQLSKPVVQLIYERSGAEAQIKLNDPFHFVVIYAPSDEKDSNKSREYVSVEPQTHLNNGFNLEAQGWKDTGVKILKPGERWGGSWELSYKQLKNSSIDSKVSST